MAKVRDPLPERIIWETERTDRYNRLHWLVLVPAARPTALPASALPPYRLPPHCLPPSAQKKTGRQYPRASSTGRTLATRSQWVYPSCSSSCRRLPRRAGRANKSSGFHSHCVRPYPVVRRCRHFGSDQFVRSVTHLARRRVVSAWVSS